MRRTLGGLGAACLERSCGRRSDSIRFGPRAHGLERAEVYLTSCAFELHRHDTYAIGIDGAPGTNDGFGYRIPYIGPELVRDSLGGGALPFVADPVQPLTPATWPIASLLRKVDEPISELGAADIAVAVADGLLSMSGRLELARTAIENGESLALAAADSGFADQSHMTRQFKRTYGMTPGRWKALTRLRTESSKSRRERWR